MQRGFTFIIETLPATVAAENRLRSSRPLAPEARWRLRYLRHMSRATRFR